MNPAPPSDTGVSGAPHAGTPAASSAAPRLMGVKLPIRVLMGRTQMCLRDITLLGSGSVVELDCSPDDPVEIVVNDRVIAQGEIVVVGGNYGVRITRIASGGEAVQPSTETDLLRLSERLK
ncbi:MAG: FliM/FliN family flagellar motor switch protein [Acidobacteriia bacterium]|nr:FliM/FliN family flagellar motor switch protein [Terriglobia bacterium]